MFPESLEEADFDQEAKEGLDVLIYTKTKKGRPWCGRIVNIQGEGRFMIQWYERKKGNTFVACFNPDGSPYTTELETETVILWNFSSKIDDKSFHVNNFFISKFKEEYCRHDSAIIDV